ncbi:MAG TPA: hypothetical protein VLS89_03230 [Candidatus Nanopelagicales bacterium]|nr:hypothetical protein [Candidatus Nanopelagicales bacterium]
MSRRIDEIVEDVRFRASRRRSRSPARWLLRRSVDADPSSFFRELGEILAEEGRKVVTFSLPRSSLDAGEHLLGQLCQSFDVGRLPQASFSAVHPLHKRIEWIARHLGAERSAPFLLLDIPNEWLIRRRDARVLRGSQAARTHP